MKMKVDALLVKESTNSLKSKLNDTISKYRNEITQIQNTINKSRGDSVDVLKEIAQAQLDSLEETRNMYEKVLVFLENSAKALKIKDDEIKNMIEQ